MEYFSDKHGLLASASMSDIFKMRILQYKEYHWMFFKSDFDKTLESCGIHGEQSFHTIKKKIVFNNFSGMVIIANGDLESHYHLIQQL